MTVNACILNALILAQCPEHAQRGSSALSVIKRPTTIVPDLEIFMFVRRNSDRNDDFVLQY
jgi:hypothetical protein